MAIYFRVFIGVVMTLWNADNEDVGLQPKLGSPVTDEITNILYKQDVDTRQRQLF